MRQGASVPGFGAVYFGFVCARWEFGAGKWRSPHHCRDRNFSIRISRRAEFPAGYRLQRVAMVSLDECIGLPDSHPASFSKYLQERLIDKVGIRETYLLGGRKGGRIRAAYQ